jgi:TonB family protein
VKTTLAIWQWKTLDSIGLSRALSFQRLQCLSYNDTVMTTSALLYRPSARWQIWLAFGCAAGLHLVAIALARNEPASFLPPTDNGVDVVIDPTPNQTPVRPVEPVPTEPPELVKSDEAFPEESSTPAKIRRKNWKPFQLIRPKLAASVSGPSLGSVKALAIFAPRPEYPYEARRQRTTGSGLVFLKIDSSIGNVTDARMAQSTGSPILDNSAVSALSRWRFKSGTVTRVRVPITYTLSGVSY